QLTIAQLPPQGDGNKRQANKGQWNFEFHFFKSKMLNDPEAPSFILRPSIMRGLSCRNCDQGVITSRFG
ncbi:MAG: hypothetical protein EBT52_04435, partial [Flavobacteriia bacterium]|nr:hypothetical protein [Flavobacteriia bacterium]